MDVSLYTFVIFISFGGFLLAFYIRHKKSSGEKMVCPIGADCDPVVHSEYSHFWGIPIEFLGMIYYGVTSVFYSLLIIFHHADFSGILPIIFIISSSAFLFSCYLTFIQAFVLKQWCSWCLISAGFSTIIFLVALGGLDFGTAVFVRLTPTVNIMHLGGIALGVGGATTANIFFFKFLRDFRISEWEAMVLKTISQVIWFALALLVISNTIRYLSTANIFSQSVIFPLQIVSILVLILSGLFLNFIVSPRLLMISFGKEHMHEAGELHRLRKAAFVLGATSIVSWYGILISETLADYQMRFSVLLGVYGAMLMCGIIGSQIIEHWLSRKASSL